MSSEQTKKTTMLTKIAFALALVCTVLAVAPAPSNAYSSGGYDASGAPVGPYGR